jgi:2-succinyl-6-hydroxy-2,4-cyclohexadiene-1-carboxylate synthase
MYLYSGEVTYYLELHQADRNLPVLLLMHGFMGSGRAFEHLLDPLKEFCNPLTIDLAGHGRTECAADTTLFETGNQVSQLHSLLTRFRFDRLFACGYSMGGRLLIQLTVLYPELFRGVLIESAHCGIIEEPERINRIKTDEERAIRIESDFQKFVDEWLRMPMFSETPGSRTQEYRNIMLAQNPYLLSASLRGFGSGVMPAVCHRLQRLSIPLYLVAGESDSSYVIRMTEMSKLCNDCRLYIVKNAGHRVHAGYPVQYTEILKTFIQTHNHV